MKHGWGILDSLNDAFPNRMLRFLGPWALLFGAYAFLHDLDDRRYQRDAQAWALVTAVAPGNSGKIDALEYLNFERPLIEIPNPRRLGFNIGPLPAFSRERPDFIWGPHTPATVSWVPDFGPWKRRTPLVGVNVSGSYLLCLHLSHADLERADLSNARLGGADLTFANLQRVNFAGADFERAKLLDPESRAQQCDGAAAELTSASLDYALLKNAKLAGVNLAGARLMYADFESATLVGANLSFSFAPCARFDGANLRGADLTAIQFTWGRYTSPDSRDPDDRGPFSQSRRKSALSMDARQRAGITSRALDRYESEQAVDEISKDCVSSFDNANVADAIFVGADLRTADMSKAVGLDSAQLAQACIDSRTKLPPQIVRPAPCEADELGVHRDNEGVPLHQHPDRLLGHPPLPKSVNSAGSS